MHPGNLKVGARLAAGFAVLLVLAIAASGVGIYALSRSHTDTAKLVEGDAARLAAALRLDSAARANGRRLPELLLSSNEAEAEKLLGHIADNTKATAAAFDELERLVEDEQSKNALAAISEAGARFTVGYRKLMLFIKRGQREDAMTIFQTQVSPALDAYTAVIVDLVRIQEDAMRKAVVASDARFANTRTMLIALTAAMVLLGVLIAWLVARSITRPLARAVEVADKVAAGDLTTVVEWSGRDETALLLHALSEMNEGLRNIVGEVRGGADCIAAASSRLATDNADLSRRTEQQAANLEETASSLEQLTSTVAHTADNAKQASELAAAAADVATTGSKVVDDVVSTMASINEASQKISEIIGVVDAIAFQTNILALNAAVEAARAGEHGRGFAVVASEVRRLAHRSADAAREIKTLISDSVQKVEGGTALVNRAGKTMAEVVGSVKGVTRIISEISTATSEQKAGVEQINRAITEMDQVTQRNAAMVEQAAATARAMHEQAQTLRGKVAVFQVGTRESEQQAVTHPLRVASSSAAPQDSALLAA